MTQEEFTRRNEPHWQRLETMIRALDEGRRRTILSGSDAIDIGDFDREYRRVCKHLSLARQRLYGTALVDYLNDLTLQAHRRFYGQRPRYVAGFARFVLGEFPALVRSRPGALWSSAALFLLPAIAIAVALEWNPDLIYSMLNAEQIRLIEEVYEPGSEYRASERRAETDLYMFGFYIWNNVGIGFRTFAGGIAFGLGPVFFLALNGLFLGATTSHIQSLGYGETFFPFVAGHSSLELTAIVLAGAAGLSLGWSLIAPGRNRRIDALRQAASTSIRIVCGVAGMLFLAAMVEAFWSPRESVPGGVRIAVGILLWLVTLAYFTFAGRQHGS